MNAGKRLQQLLDYVGHYATDLKKAPSAILETLPCYTNDHLKQLDGLVIFNEGRWWFKLQRQSLVEVECLSEEVLAIVKKTAKEQNPGINWSRWPKNAYLVPHLNQKNHLRANACKGLPRAIQLWCQCQKYIKNYQAQQSKKVYDHLFNWYMSLAEGTQGNIEVVAGFGYLSWILPSGVEHNYPLITTKIELDLAEDGSIYVGISDTKPQLELDALNADSNILGLIGIRTGLQELIDGGFIFDLFKDEALADMLSCVEVGLGSSAKIIYPEQLVPIDTNPQILNTTMLFARPSRNSILSDDIVALKQAIEAYHDELPELPLSLVSDLKDVPRAKINKEYRGVSRIAIGGENIDELYFPLPGNKEQISVIKQLDSSPGVIVQGPPGTGKTHTIANIICQYLANGKKILVTAQQPHVLKTLYEKIPESIRSLAVSRIGNSQESKRQLENNIDQIIEKLSQINELEVLNEISAAMIELDRLHFVITEIDNEISDFAKSSSSAVLIDGRSYTPLQIHEALKVSSNEDLYWFVDSPFDGEMGDFPLTPIELTDVISAREKIGGMLPKFSIGTWLKQPILLTPEAFGLLLEQFRAIQRATKLIQEHPHVLNMQSSADGLKEILSVFDRWGRSLLRIYENNQSAPAILKLYSSESSIERHIFNELLERNMDLTSCRKNFLKNPVELPAEYFTNSQVLKAITRGANGEKPLPWYVFDSKLQNCLNSIKVLGRAVSSQDDWVLVLNHVKLNIRVNELAAQWNNIAKELALPMMVGDLRQLLNTFDDISNLKIDVERHNREHTAPIKNLLLKLVSSNKFDELDVHALTPYVRLIEAILMVGQQDSCKSEVDKYIKGLDGLDFYKCGRLIELLETLKAGSANAAIEAEYTQILNTLSLMKLNQPFFELIKTASDKLSLAGAPILADRILKEPCDDLYCDLHQYDILKVWHLKRLKIQLERIADSSKLRKMEARRKSYEGLLSVCYEELVANKTWLALKQNASEQVLVSLSRYKVAVYKIGKGTGKNAERYRKDAQDALALASSAIPCWIMSHLQVSETMPATLGLFDLVIVDEASQSSIEAIPVLMRAKKILIVGDNKQVSPSNVGLSVDQINVMRSKYLIDQPHKHFLTPDMSLYDIGSAIYDSNVMLLEHFRCHPDIIEYSNNNYYGGRIKPMRISKNSERFDPPLVSIYVADGKRETKGGKHINHQEAMAVIKEMKCLFADPFCYGKTIGVVSLLGSVQAEYIQTLALDTFGAIKLSEVRFACGEASAFQGAEKDIVFLSLVADSENCAPLSRLAHEQRFNVAASRAKERMYLIHSVNIADLSGKDLRVPLLTHFTAGVIKPTNLEFEELLRQCRTSFEIDICRRFHDDGYKIWPHKKIGSSTVDFVIEDGDSRVIIECDGDTEEFDLANWTKLANKQRDLERAGWDVIRVFASIWHINPESTFLELKDDLRGLKIHPQNIEEPVMYE